LNPVEDEAVIAEVLRRRGELEIVNIRKEIEEDTLRDEIDDVNSLCTLKNLIWRDGLSEWGMMDNGNVYCCFSRVHKFCPFFHSSILLMNLCLLSSS
jgi:16S rRNA C967 or C1407 C5-methylase (RsmB/RsmF family)